MLFFSCAKGKKGGGLGLALALANSGGGSGSGSGSSSSSFDYKEDNVRNLESIAITDAETLYIGTSGGSSPSNNNIAASIQDKTNQLKKLFKITSTGAVLEVTYKNKKGETVEDIQVPSRILILSDTYLFFDFSDFSYLVNKKDGKTYEYNGSPLNQSSTIRGSFIENDTQGNIYFAEELDKKLELGTTTRNLIKLDVTDPNKITRKVFITSHPFII